ncbi:MAG: flavin reductase family protein [Pseudomonadota bacterium]
MFYDPRHTDAKTDLGLPHDPFKALVQPRPIGWISSRSKAGLDNLAPYSFFNALAAAPPLVMFSANGSPHSIANAKETGVFVVNMVTEELAQAMNATATQDAVDEFERAGLAKAECERVNAPRVAASPVALECEVVDIITLPGAANIMAIGAVVGIHLDDAILVDGQVRAWTPIARLGYKDYTAVRDVFSLDRPA